MFPYLFVKNNLDYIGNVPDFSYFTNITLDQYTEYCNNYSNNWNLREATINYCLQDCVSLYQVLDKFNNYIFDLYKLNIVDYPTLPSLSFAIYRSHYLEKNTIAQLSGQIFNHIKQSYTGGAVDSYIPEGKNIYAYDVNSLYPYVMLSNPMPVGSPTYFQGDITLKNPQAFGFFNCKVTSPTNLKNPIIQTHIQTKNGIRTIAGLGTFNTMLFSEEINNAKKFGYQFEILSGYTFNKSNIFFY